MIGQMLDSKQLRANADNSIYVVIGDHKSRTSCLEEVEEMPKMMGTHKLENPPAEKFHGDQISQEGTFASILETLDKKMKGIDNKQVQF